MAFATAKDADTLHGGRLSRHSSPAVPVSGSAIGGGVGGACVGSGWLPTGRYPLFSLGSNCGRVSFTCRLSVSPFLRLSVSVFGHGRYFDEVEELHILHPNIDPAGMLQRAFEPSGLGHGPCGLQIQVCGFRVARRVGPLPVIPAYPGTALQAGTYQTVAPTPEDLVPWVRGPTRSSAGAGRDARTAGKTSARLTRWSSAPIHPARPQHH